MAFAETRIRSLETARECVRLGARQRTIAWVTGLPASFIFHKVFDARHRAPRGRPPDTGAAATGDDAVADPSSGQLAPTLPIEVTAETGPPPDAPAAPAAPVAPAFKLVAPLRLNPMVRDALAAAIASMNGDARAADAITVSSGVFVPLDHFKRRHVDIPVVLRSLAETGMTVAGNASRARTVQHEMRGQPELGFVIKPGFVEGLDPSDFLTPG